MWHVYWLTTNKGPIKTYIGKTNDLDRRLKQHNGILSGGAKATHGKNWTRVCHVKGFVDERAALQFEWAWKFYSRVFTHSHPYKKRLEALYALLTSEKVTSNAQVMDNLEVVWESDLDPFDFY